MKVFSKSEKRRISHITKRMSKDEISHRLRMSEKPSVYVLEGLEEGFHDFNTYEAATKFIEHLLEADYDFVINPNW